jgi:hypothetical protein
MAHDSTISDELRRALDEAIAAMDHFKAAYALIGGIVKCYSATTKRFLE